MGISVEKPDELHSILMSIKLFITQTPNKTHSIFVHDRTIAKRVQAPNFTSWASDAHRARGCSLSAKFHVHPQFLQLLVAKCPVFQVEVILLRCISSHNQKY